MYTCSFSSLFFFSELKSPRMHVLLFLHKLDPHKKKGIFGYNIDLLDYE